MIRKTLRLVPGAAESTASPSGQSIHIWYQATRELDAAEAEFADLVLSSEERARRDRFRFAKDRRDFAIAHDLLRRSLSKFDPSVQPQEWEFDTDASGKPSIRGRSGPEFAIEFSLSHTREFVACAVSTVQVGIDVERIVPQFEFGPIVRRHFSADEFQSLQQLPAADRVRRFFELWTLKESYLKADGCGLSRPLEDFSFHFEGPAVIRFEAPPGTDAKPWQFALLAPRPDVSMAVASKSTQPTCLFLQDVEVSSDCAARGELGSA